MRAGVRAPDAPGALKRVLSYTPYLEELSVDGVFPLRALKWLAGTQSTADTTQPRQLPLKLLDSLSIISYSHIGDKHLRPLQEMIMNRNPTVDASIHQLQELKLKTNKVWCGSDDVLDSLESLCEDMGIEFEFVEEGNCHGFGCC